LDFANPSPEFARILKHDLIMNRQDEEGRWAGVSTAPVLINFKSCTRPVKSAFVGMTSLGDLTSFQWIESYNYKKTPN
jgi:hypothetical protein